MSTVGLVLHCERPSAVELAKEAAAWLLAADHQVMVDAPDAAAAGLEGLACPVDVFGPGLDLAISLGGDGTMLRAVRMVATHDVPVLGVNVGHLGYLTEVEPASLLLALERFLAGSYELEPRMMLDVTVESSSGDVAEHTPAALNEAVLEKTPMGHMVRLEVAIDGKQWATYVADGLIVATPTGSTAYAFSARGPIIAPRHRAMQLTPVAPHMLFDRTIVLEPSAIVRLEVSGDRATTLSVDGSNLGTLHPGDAIVCTASPHSAQLVSFGGRDFHEILKRKFGLDDR